MNQGASCVRAGFRLPSLADRKSPSLADFDLRGTRENSQSPPMVCPDLTDAPDRLAGREICILVWLVGLLGVPGQFSRLSFSLGRRLHP